MKHQIVIKRHRPGFRAGLIAAAASLLAISGWALYSYTRATTVSDFERAQLDVEKLRDERRELTRQLRATKSEVSQLKDQVAYAARSGEIDGQACDAIKGSLGTLQAEVSDLREQLAFYRGIVAPDVSRAGVRVYEFKLSKTPTSTQFHYELVLIQSSRNDRVVGGKIAVSIEGMRGGAQEAVKLDQLIMGETKNLQFSFKYFEEFSGDFRLPEGFKPMRVWVTLAPDATGIPAVKEQFDWVKIIKS